MTHTLPPESEAGFQKAVIALARLCGWRVAHFRPGRVMRHGVWKYETPVAADGKGWPDLVMCRRKTLLVVECKRDGGKTTPEQDAWLAAFAAIPGVIVCTWFPSDWDCIVDTLTNA